MSNALELPPTEIAFLDDSLECVNAAIGVGMYAHQCVGFGDLQIRLRALEIFDGRGPYWAGD